MTMPLTLEAETKLLFAAAKAAQTTALGYVLHGILCENKAGHPYIWNPLHNDSDAFRLQVKLGLVVNVWNMAKVTEVSRDDIEMAIQEKHGGDPLTATRLAITKMAAIIGEKK